MKHKKRFGFSRIDPISREKVIANTSGIKSIRPTKGQFKQALNYYTNEWLESTSDPRIQDAIIRTQVELGMRDVNAKVDSEFEARFHAFLLGRMSDIPPQPGRPYTKTPIWGNRHTSLMQDPEVKAYINELTDQRFEFDRFIQILTRMGPVSWDGKGGYGPPTILEYYLYFKYVLEEHEEYDTDTYLSDWKIWKEKRHHTSGAYQYDPDGNMISPNIAPYSTTVNKFGKGERDHTWATQGAPWRDTTIADLQYEMKHKPGSKKPKKFFFQGGFKGPKSGPNAPQPPPVDDEKDALMKRLKKLQEKDTRPDFKTPKVPKSAKGTAPDALKQKPSKPAASGKFVNTGETWTSTINDLGKKTLDTITPPPPAAPDVAQPRNPVNGQFMAKPTPPSNDVSHASQAERSDSEISEPSLKADRTDSQISAASNKSYVDSQKETVAITVEPPSEHTSSKGKQKMEIDDDDTTSEMLTDDSDVVPMSTNPTPRIQVSTPQAVSTLQALAKKQIEQNQPPVNIALDVLNDFDFTYQVNRRLADLKQGHVISYDTTAEDFKTGNVQSLIPDLEWSDHLGGMAEKDTSIAQQFRELAEPLVNRYYHAGLQQRSDVVLVTNYAWTAFKESWLVHDLKKESEPFAWLVYNLFDPTAIVEDLFDEVDIIWKDPVGIANQDTELGVKTDSVPADISGVDDIPRADYEQFLEVTLPLPKVDATKALEVKPAVDVLDVFDAYLEYDRNRPKTILNADLVKAKGHPPIYSKELTTDWYDWISNKSSKRHMRDVQHFLAVVKAAFPNDADVQAVLRDYGSYDRISAKELSLLVAMYLNRTIPKEIVDKTQEQIYGGINLKNVKKTRDKFDLKLNNAYLAVMAALPYEKVANWKPETLNNVFYYMADVVDQPRLVRRGIKPIDFKGLRPAIVPKKQKGKDAQKVVAPPPPSKPGITEAKKPPALAKKQKGANVDYSIIRKKEKIEAEAAAKKAEDEAKLAEAKANVARIMQDAAVTRNERLTKQQNDELELIKKAEKLGVAGNLIAVYKTDRGPEARSNLVNAIWEKEHEGNVGAIVKIQKAYRIVKTQRSVLKTMDAPRRAQKLYDETIEPVLSAAWGGDNQKLKASRKWMKDNYPQSIDRWAVKYPAELGHLVAVEKTARRQSITSEDATINIDDLFPTDSEEENLATYLSPGSTAEAKEGALNSMLFGQHFMRTSFQGKMTIRGEIATRTIIPHILNSIDMKFTRFQKESERAAIQMYLKDMAKLVAAITMNAEPDNPKARNIIRDKSADALDVYLAEELNSDEKEDLEKLNKNLKIDVVAMWKEEFEIARGRGAVSLPPDSSQQVINELGKQPIPASLGIWKGKKPVIAPPPPNSVVANSVEYTGDTYVPTNEANEALKKQKAKDAAKKARAKAEFDRQQRLKELKYDVTEWGKSLFNKPKPKP